MQHVYARIELFGGPLDGERRTVLAGLTRYVTTAPESICNHLYVKTGEGRFDYRGTVPGPTPPIQPGDEYRNGDV